MTTFVLFVPSATGLWVIITLSTSFQKLVSVHHVFGSASSTLQYRDPNPRSRDIAPGLYEVAHLVLCALLEKHEDEDDQGQRPQLAELGMNVSRDALKRKRNLLDDTSSQVNERANEPKLESNL